MVAYGFLRELWKFARISSSHVCVAFRGLLQNTFFESSKKIRFQKKLKLNGFCIKELGHFENRSMKKKLLNLQNVCKYKQFTIGFSIVKYPDFNGFRRFSSFFFHRPIFKMT